MKKEPQATPLSALDPHALALKVSFGMYERDLAARHLGIKITDAGPDFATLTMVVEPHMVNGHDLGHGGLTFTLADTAFAYACNARNEASVAASCSIDFLAPSHKGDTLTATARETTRSGRYGIYDITVVNQDGTIIASMRGRSASLRKPVIEE